MPVSFIDSLKKILEEKSLKMPADLEDENGAQNIFERADWKNSKLAGVILGMEDYVKLEET